MGRPLVHAAFLVAVAAQAQAFQLPTANHALFNKGGEERFLVGTAGKPWTTGAFGCVRTGGWQMHEGLDIAGKMGTSISAPAWRWKTSAARPSWATS